MPIRDLKVDVSPSLPCPDRLPQLASAGAARQHGVTPIDGGSREAWISRPADATPALGGGTLIAQLAHPIPTASPHVLGVFRPPRG